MRISQKDLENVVSRINRVMGTPAQPYVNGEPQAHCYHLSHEYRGYALHQMCSTGSGVRDVFGGHLPKRDLYDRMQAFLAGVDAARTKS